MKTFVISEAYYLNGNDLVTIAGIPSQNNDDMYSYGTYTGKYPYVAASKAFTGLQKYLKKFHKDSEWFPGYDPKNPPSIVYNLINVETGKSQYYQGYRVPALQGNRTVINSEDGRIREYKWDNIINKIKLE